MIEDMIQAVEANIVKYKAMGDDAAVKVAEGMIAELKEYLLRETTKDLLPHVYYVNKKSGKLVAFQPVDGQVKIFTKPLTFGKRYRKFEVLREIEEIK